MFIYRYNIDNLLKISNKLIVTIDYKRSEHAHIQFIKVLAHFMRHKSAGALHAT